MGGDASGDWEGQIKVEQARHARMVTDCRQLVTLHTVLTPAQAVAHAGAEYHSVEQPAQATAPGRARCEWPKCSREALCSSGNFSNRLVCAEHFKITNGEATIGWNSIGPLVDAMIRDAYDAALAAERASHQQARQQLLDALKAVTVASRDLSDAIPEETLAQDGPLRAWRDAASCPLLKAQQLIAHVAKGVNFSSQSETPEG